MKRRREGGRGAGAPNMQLVSPPKENMSRNGKRTVKTQASGFGPKVVGVPLMRVEALADNGHSQSHSWSNEIASTRDLKDSRLNGSIRQPSESILEARVKCTSSVVHANIVRIGVMHASKLVSPPGENITENGKRMVKNQASDFGLKVVDVPLVRVETLAENGRKQSHSWSKAVESSRALNDSRLNGSIRQPAGDIFEAPASGISSSGAHSNSMRIGIMHASRLSIGGGTTPDTTVSRNGGSLKRKRDMGHDLATRSSAEIDRLPVAASSCVDRVWEYVCKRSVLVSPTLQRVNTRQEVVPCGFGMKTVRTEVVVQRWPISVTLTREGSIVQEWIERQSDNFFGFDLEWRPNFRKGRDNKVSLLQVSTRNECLLVQLLFLDRIPEALVHFLGDPERKFVGVGVLSDIKKLRRDHGLVCNGAVELTNFAVSQLKCDKFKNMGLKHLVMEILGFDMNKRKSVTMSDWSQSRLDRHQVEYACKDAWVSLAVLLKLQELSRESPMP